MSLVRINMMDNTPNITIIVVTGKFDAADDILTSTLILKKKGGWRVVVAILFPC